MRLQISNADKVGCYDRLVAACRNCFCLERQASASQIRSRQPVNQWLEGMRGFFFENRVTNPAVVLLAKETKSACAQLVREL
jgi:hypothetical protein